MQIKAATIGSLLLALFPLNKQRGAFTPLVAGPYEKRASTKGHSRHCPGPRGVNSHGNGYQKGVDHAPPFVRVSATHRGVTGILINPKPHVRVSGFFTVSPGNLPDKGLSAAPKIFNTL
jgi:hypothetical protein